MTHRTPTAQAFGRSRSPRMTLSGIVLDAADARTLAAFYERLLGWTVEQDEPGWVKLASPDSGAGLSFQSTPGYVPPMWPAQRGEQQMMIHLDIAVDDLQEAGAHALASGAAPAPFQPQQTVHVYLDPEGHPFCLFLPE